MRTITLFLIIILSIVEYGYAADDGFCKSTNYRNYDDILSGLTTLRNISSNLDTPPAYYATLITAGTTTGGRPIQGIVITSPTGASNKEKILITGAIHANEWIGTEVAIGLAEYLIANKTNATPVDFYPFASTSIPDPKNMNIKALLENIEVLIIPVLNLDGYVYSWTNFEEVCLSTEPTPSCYDESTGLPYCWWRKNRRDLSAIKPGSYGVDINRNFAMNYVASPDSEVDTSTYAGQSKMSEKENIAIQTLFDTYHFSASLHLHAGTEPFVLYPWGDNAEIESTRKDLRKNSGTSDIRLFQKMGAKIATNVGFSHDSVSSTPYEDHPRGVARDWEYATYKAASFVIEVDEDHQPEPLEGVIGTVCKSQIKGPLWLMFWAADQGFRSKPKLQIGNN